MTVTLFASCDKTKTVILSKFPNGNPKEIIELQLPITKDSIGLMKVFFDDKKLRAFGQAKNKKREGQWICYFQNGNPEWKAIYKDDIENGEVTCYNENGGWRKMNVINGVKNGKTVEFNYYPLDSMYCYVYGQYVNDLEQGLWTKTDTAGVLLIEMTYVNGEHNGYFTNRYKNGKIRLKGELNKDNSMKNFKFYDENGVEKKQDSYLLRVI